MKKICVMSVAMAALCSCTDVAEVGDPSDKQVPTVEVDINATIKMPQNNTPTTRIESDFGTDMWGFKWEANDPLYCITPDNNNSTVATSMTQDSGFSDGEATYSGITNIDLIYDDNTKGFYALLYSKDQNTYDDDNIKLPSPYIDLSEQDGNLSDLIMLSDKIEVAETSATISTVSPALKHIGGFLDIKINYGSVPSEWSGVTLENVVINGAISTAYLNATQYVGSVVNYDWDNPICDNSNSNGYLDAYDEPQSTDSEDACYNIITVTPGDKALVADKDLQLYVNVLPTELNSADRDLTITVNFSNGRHYTFAATTTSGKDIERGKFYQEEFTVDYGALANWLTPFKNGMKYTSTPDTQTTYEIETAEQLKNLSVLSDMGALATDANDIFKLTDNIDLGSSTDEWEPLCKDGFYGTFDGDDKEITDLYIDDNPSSGTDLALFAKNSDGATIQNVVINKAIIKGSGNLAALVSTNKGTVKSCEFKCDNGIIVGSNQTGNGVVGGLVAHNTSTGNITSCTSAAYISGGMTDVGGIVGKNDGSVSDCDLTSNGNITGETLVGGIIGNNTGSVSGCETTSRCSVAGSDQIGGIVGGTSGEGSSVENCTNEASVDGATDVGGIAGIVGPGGNSISGSVENCKNTGTVTGKTNVGGTVGHVSGVVKFMQNSGVVTGKTNSSLVGGVAGYIDYGYCLNSWNQNSGTITGAEKVGGVVGACDRGSYIVGCRNAAMITSINGRTGGIIGHNDNGWVYSCYNINAMITASAKVNYFVGSVIGYYGGGDQKANNNFYTTFSLMGRGLENSAAVDLTTDNGAIGRGSSDLQNVSTTNDLNGAIDTYNNASESTEDAAQWIDTGDTAFPIIDFPEEE